MGSLILISNKLETSSYSVALSLSLFHKSTIIVMISVSVCFSRATTNKISAASTSWITMVANITGT